LANRTAGGARVVLRLPFQPAGTRPEAMLVLLVEDSPELRIQVREMLCEQGHSVIEAASAAEALALATIEGLGLVLSDIHLAGGETGFELARQLRNTQPDLALGLMTSLPVDDELHTAARAAFAVLRKPVTSAALDAFVRHCVSQSATSGLAVAG